MAFNSFRQKLTLASSSPRRAEILNIVGWPFEVEVAGIDETQKAGENPHEYVQRLALEKALAVASKLSSGLVLGADTTVVVQGEVLGQPRDDDDGSPAAQLLQEMSAAGISMFEPDPMAALAKKKKRK